MLALQIVESVPRYVLAKAIGRFRPEVYWNGWGLLQLRDVPEPPLPTAEWVRIGTRLSGICGSDLGVITLHASPTTSPLVSFPFTLGHELVGTIRELGAAVEGFHVGQRVVVNPLLGCVARGFRDLCSECARGLPNRCLRFREGTVAPGIMIGFCRDTGGGWSPGFVAHRSQLVPVPEHLTDEEAVLAEPFGVALHAAFQNRPADGSTVLVLGAGIIGLLTVVALRAIGCRARILVTARYPFQAEAASRLGADVVLRGRSGPALYRELARLTGARVYRARFGRWLVQAGVDQVFDCVGSSRSVQDALAVTRAGGRVVMVGLAGDPHGVDWTPVWLREVEIRGSMAYADAVLDGIRASSIHHAVRLMAERRVELGWLVTHRFALTDYRAALATVTAKGNSGVIKAVFAFPS
ncbi:MAG: zinc-binding dehydrogenase [Thermomicrobium sp.]|nr:zinc-binding dehydrogenase [Thermomicrobium sp.]